MLTYTRHWRYNGLPRIHSSMRISLDHVKKLEAIITQYNLREKLGIHLLHKHDDIANGHINLETELETIPGKWVKPVPIDSLNLNQIHGVIFKFTPESNILVPYEFAMGPSPISTNNIVDDCVRDICGYIATHSLANTTALEFLEPVKGGQPIESVAEFETGNGTIIVPKSMVRAVELVATGWPNISQPFDPDAEPAPGTHWAPVKVGTKETHRVFVDQVENETELLDKLARQGVLKV
jgi:hypothetical protein